MGFMRSRTHFFVILRDFAWSKVRCKGELLFDEAATEKYSEKYSSALSSERTKGRDLLEVFLRPVKGRTEGKIMILIGQEKEEKAPSSTQRLLKEI